jgi:hypothetical protein
LRKRAQAAQYLAIRPLFSPEFNEQLRLGKYTSWAVHTEFTAAHLECLLRLIEEYDAGAEGIIDLLARHGARGGRGHLALEALHGIARGDRLTVDQWVRRMRSGSGYTGNADQLPTGRRSRKTLTRGRFTDDELRGLFWVIGEFVSRSYGMFEVLEQHRSEIPKEQRALAALWLLERFALGQRFDSSELQRRLLEKSVIRRALVNKPSRKPGAALLPAPRRKCRPAGLRARPPCRGSSVSAGRRGV